MRSALWHFCYAFLLVLVSDGLSHAVAQRDLKTEIVLDHTLSDDALPPWLAYAGSRSVWMRKKFFELNPQASAYRYTFAEELEAREACARVWAELKAKHGGSEPYLDDLASVHKAGFLREYTWVYLKAPDWGLPEGLRLVEFDQWREEHLARHTPETRAMARFRRQ